jgi:hypothetical protein
MEKKKVFSTTEVQELIKDLLKDLLKDNVDRLNEILKEFKSNYIDGEAFLKLGEKELIDILHISEFGIKTKILSKIKEFHEKEENLGKF